MATWKAWEVQTIRQLAKLGYSDSYILAMVPGRSRKSIQAKRRQLGVFRRKPKQNTRIRGPIIFEFPD